MAATATMENALLLHIFQNAAVANVGDAAGLQPSAGAGSLYVSLHTADPSAGDQTTSEATYTGYSATGRIPVARSSAGWTVAANALSNAAAITFGACTAGSSTVTYFGIGSAASG